MSCSKPPTPSPTKTRARGSKPLFTDTLPKNDKTKAPRPRHGRGVGVRERCTIY
ncbi:hypothetical protein JOD20_005384 [Herpetosiphon giganteus]|nr:hypothetical protein [Herpetosiphon giganteus]